MKLLALAATLALANAEFFLQIVTKDGILYSGATLANGAKIESFNFAIDSWDGTPSMRDLSIGKTIDAGDVVLLQHLTTKEKLPKLIVSHFKNETSLSYELSDVLVTSYSTNSWRYDNEDTSSTYVQFTADRLDMTGTGADDETMSFSWNVPPPTQQKYWGMSDQAVMKEVESVVEEA